MAYELNQFIDDVKATLQPRLRPRRARDRAQESRAPAREQGLRRGQTCGEDAPLGLKVLYEDKDLGFQVLAHVNDKARKSPPHDHGASWAIYGQATKHTDMIEWERTDNGGAQAELKEVKRYRLNPGQAGIYQDGAIHSIDYPDRARFIRVTGTNLDKINRVRFDLNTGEVHQMTPQQAT